MQQFEKFDSNKNGYLESNEIHNYLKNILEQVGKNGDCVGEGDVKEFIQHIDADKDGKVSCSELLDFIKKYI